MATNESLTRRAAEVLPRGNSRATLYVAPASPFAVSGQGTVVTDADGHRVIDMNNNYTSLIHGHADPRVREAALRAMEHGTAFGLPTEGEVALAELLSARFGSPMHWRFANSGSEAVMMAMRAARAFTGRELVVRLAGAYHGTYDQVVTPDEPGVPRAARDATISVPQDDEEALVAAFRTHGERIAAVLVDLMPNRIGLQPVAASFAAALRAEADAAGALVIVDEIITFRLGTGGLQQAYGLRADLTTLAKIIGGGFPVGAVGGRPEVMAVFDPEQPSAVHWGGTFNANPVTMAAGAAAMAAYDESAIDALNERGDALRCRLLDAGVAVTGRGSLMSLHPDDSEATWWELYRRGVLVSVNGLMALSTAMTDEHLGTVASAIIDVTRA